MFIEFSKDSSKISLSCSRGWVLGLISLEIFICVSGVIISESTSEMSSFSSSGKIEISCSSWLPWFRELTTLLNYLLDILRCKQNNKNQIVKIYWSHLSMPE